jgi:hypothetical protein
MNIYHFLSLSSLVFDSMFVVSKKTNYSFTTSILFDFKLMSLVQDVK